MTHTLLRIVLAVMLATCSPAWCACVVARPAATSPTGASCVLATDGDSADHASACDDHAAFAVATACCDQQGSEPGDHSQRECACSCCDSTDEFSLTRDAMEKTTLVAFTLPAMPPVLMQVELSLRAADDDASQGLRANRHGEHNDIHGRAGGQTLLGQGSLLLI